MTYELKIESPLIDESAPNYLSSSLSQSEDFVISFNRDGSVLSRYGDWVWDLSPYSGAITRISFASVCGVGESAEIRQKNVACYKRIAFYFLYGPRKVISAKTAYRLCDVIGRVIKHCNSCGIPAEMLGRFDRVVDTLATGFTPSYARDLPRLLLELKGARKDLGFELVDYAQIARIKQQLPHSEVKQTAYIPQRIYAYQLTRCKEMLDDYRAHRERFESSFKQCIEEYARAYGSLEMAFTGSDQNPFNPSGRGFCGTTFLDLAKANGVADVMERWVVPYDRTIEEYDISIFGKYFGAVQFVGRIYLLNYSGMRIEEGSHLRTSCLVKDCDPVLGDVCMLRGETSKTVDDDSALWISSKEAELAVEAMASVARMRLCAAEQDSRIALVQRDIDDPRLVTRAYEPWGISVARTSDPSRRVHAPYSTWRGRCPRLFSDEELKLSSADFEEAVRMTPSLDTEKFAVGQVWPLAYHQLRRTLNCNAAGSGMVSLKSLQYQMKHQHETMTQYYGHNYSALQLNQSMRKDYAEAVVDALVSKAVQIVGDDFVSPFGPDHKARKTEFITRNDMKVLKAKAKKGRLSVRENALGVCLFSGYCPYGGLDSVVSCVECDDLLADRRKRDQFVRLAQEVEIELSAVNYNDKIYRESLMAQQVAMKKVIDVLLI